MEENRIEAIIFGNSHANCLAASINSKAYQAAAPGYNARVVAYGSDGLPGGLVMRSSSDQVLMNPILAKAVQTARRANSAAKIWIVAAWGGNVANRLALFKPTVAYDMLLPGEDRETDPTAVLITYDAVCRAFEKHLSSVSDFFQVLPKGVLAGFAYLEGPPPVSSNQYVFDHLPTATKKLAEKSGYGVVDVKSINDPELRWRLWRCQCDVARRITEQHGALYISTPKDALDQTGRRLETTWKDAMHGTTEYGALCMEEIERSIVCHEGHRRGVDKPLCSS